MYHKLQIIDCTVYHVYANRNISRIRVKIELFFDYGDVIKNKIINSIKGLRRASIIHKCNMSPLNILAKYNTTI